MKAQGARRVFGLLAALATATALSACGQPHPISSSSRTLAVTRADLPSGWQVDESGTKAISNPRDLIGDSADTSPYTDNGWVGAYEADFTSPAAQGPTRVAALISVFGDSDGAKSFFENGIGGQRLEASQHPLVNRPTFGDQSQTFYQRFETGSSGPEIRYWFYWRDRNVVARILIAGSLALTESEATRIAETQARIIRQH